MPALHFRVDGNILKTELVSKTSRHDNRVFSLSEFSSNTNPKWPAVIATFLNSSGLVQAGP